ncbi:addiction module antitoxin [Sphingobium sp. SA2]|uniref:type II toxin-antitoxin system RelB family antitoxin n=1 Tax=Sphingobium sp. SA2 TaxID=1524832 RepID=UPI0039191F54
MQVDDNFHASDFDPPPHLMSPEDPAEYDAWFRAEVEAAMASTEPGIPHEEVMKELQAILDRHKNKS